MRATKEHAKKLWCPRTSRERGADGCCFANQCMLWVELGDDLGCCGYSGEAAWALFGGEEDPCDKDE